MKKEMSYLDRVHRAGRIGSLAAVAFMLGIPMVMGLVYHCLPSFGAVVQVAIPLLLFMLPTDFSEIIGYAPILGSASYITFITGNVANLKLPVVISAQQMAEVEPNTEVSDAVSSMAVALSSMVTVTITTLGLILLVPLQPLLSLPAVKTATDYLIPAVFGSLFIGIITHEKGQRYMKNKPLLVLAVTALAAAAVILFPVVLDYQGFAIIAAIAVTVLLAYPLYKLGVVRFVQPDAQDKGQ